MNDLARINISLILKNIAEYDHQAADDQVKAEFLGFCGALFEQRSDEDLAKIASVIFHDKFKNITNSNDPVPITKGDEIGYFQYGGSLNILLFEPGRFNSLSLLQGQRIGLMK